MAFGIAKGFGLEKKLQAQMLENAQGQETVINQMIEFSQQMLDNTQGGLVAGIGVLFLFWTVIKMMGHIENAFNQIWGVKLPRTLSRKITDYVSFLLVAPVLLIMSSSLTVFVASQITEITQRISMIGFLSPLILFGVKFIPMMMFWCLFTFVYMYMPNTKVNLKSGFVAGVITGTIYQIVQYAYIHFQVGVANYNAIYGSFCGVAFIFNMASTELVDRIIWSRDCFFSSECRYV